MTGGYNEDFQNGDVPPEEVINPHSSLSSCSYLNQDRTPWTRRGHRQVGLTVCGDIYGGNNRHNSNCETFANGMWNVSHNLLQSRTYHSMWESPEGILVMGGYYSNTHTTTELLQDDGTSVYKFTLPYSLRYVVCVS